MPNMRNLVKEKIAANGYALGAFVASGSANLCEILALNGLDFILIDMEHAQTNMETMVDMARASELYGMAPLVRVYDPADGPMMARMLDVGIHGLMVPMVSNRKTADYVIDNVKTAPMGHRGMGGGRGPRWGYYENYNKGDCNDNSLVVMQCETREAVENIEEICQTPGLDVIFIGTGDLSQDMGCYGNTKDPEFVAAIDKVLKACQKYNIIPGIVGGNMAGCIARIKQGFQFVTVMNDQGFFRSETKKHIDGIRAGIAD